MSAGPHIRQMPYSHRMEGTISRTGRVRLKWSKRAGLRARYRARRRRISGGPIRVVFGELCFPGLRRNADWPVWSEYGNVFGKIPYLADFLHLGSHVQFQV